jgi:hypothetical protein
MRDSRLTPYTTAVLAAVVIVAWVALSVAAKEQNLPYTTIDHPQFVRASQARYLSQNDLLIGVTDGKVAKAYPSAILAQHGVVQDQTADGPIAITW